MAVASIVAIVDTNDCWRVRLRLVNWWWWWRWRRVVGSWWGPVGDWSMVAISDERNWAYEGANRAWACKTNGGDGLGS